jgi:ATP-dependent DNA helicase RecQ
MESNRSASFSPAPMTPSLGNFTFGDTPTPEAVSGVVREVLGMGEFFDVSVSELSFNHDMRPLVVETLLTYLELDNLLVSTGPFYSEYKFYLTQPLDQILASFDAQRAAFLGRVLAQARQGQKWSRLDVHAAAQTLNEDRQRIVAALNYLEEKGQLVLEATGVRQGYRRLNAAETAKLASPAPDGRAEIQTLVSRFAAREKRDIERLDQVLAFTWRDGCKTRYLVNYFGEAMDWDCGHCAACRGHHPAPLPMTSDRESGPREQAIVDNVKQEKHPALASPRQLARFLCGLPSPRASRAKLSKHSSFGAMSHVPFQRVLELIASPHG